MFHSDTINGSQFKGKVMTNLFRPAKNEAQKTKFLLSGMAVAIIMFAFQNCGKVNHNDGPPSLEGSVEHKPSVLDVADATDLVLIKKDVDENGFFVRFAYDVDIETGLVDRTFFEVPAEDPQNRPVRLCLSEAKRLVLKNIAEKSKVCFYQANNNPGRVCAQVYRYPYAIVSQARAGIRNIEAGASFRLGESNSACGDTYDICSETHNEFVSAVNNALEGIDDSVCK